VSPSPIVAGTPSPRYTMSPAAPSMAASSVIASPATPTTVASPTGAKTSSPFSSGVSVGSAKKPTPA
jgi:hypothetical protein